MGHLVGEIVQWLLQHWAFSNQLLRQVGPYIGPVLMLLLVGGALWVYFYTARSRLAKSRLTPLMVSACEGKFALASDLLEQGADINEVDGNGATALIYAVLNDQEGVARLLLERGADPLISTMKGRTALDVAEERDNEQMVSLLRQFVK